VNPALKKFLIPFVTVDLIFCIVVVLWLTHRGPGHGWGGKPDFHVEMRHLESKLTEIDLVNRGKASGPVNKMAVEVTWPDAELVDAKGLTPFSETSTGRRGERFFIQGSAAPVIAKPGQPVGVGWVKLTDDVPINAEIVDAATIETQP
jgi:hypothetical protein